MQFSAKPIKQKIHNALKVTLKYVGCRGVIVGIGAPPPQSEIQSYS